ncbi:glycine cleavage system aminomethyltransferase GcvT [Corynebacterium provencense]|uniref:glycine cleavage system aminomethyltransferase GcvT n=1 Tax=Corynebacterium provencense TaxID=1737425 RepID=UPI0008302232|nr:glycine cleavage system aminomethyltransferase GcvT [Corynebacterium provencense]
MPRKTALHDIHAELGAKFTDFGGWDMPLRYASELDEHRAVRGAVGVFDLSHMGEIRVTGPEAAAFLDHALISRISAVKLGKAKYSMICREDGGIIDDLITYALGENEYLVVPNAGNARTVFEEFTERIGNFNVTVVDETEETSLIAVQGPKAAEVMLRITDSVTAAPAASGAAADGDSDPVEAAVEGLHYYAAFRGTVAGVPALIARTGYTGEDGFEIFVRDTDPDDTPGTGSGAGSGAATVWRAALAAGEPFGVLPCGLAARDTLRLEAGMPLYGHELSTAVTPVDAGLGVLAATGTKDVFVGRDAILAAKEKGPDQHLIGLVGEGRRAAREGYEIRDAEGNRLGEITSGALSPTLGHPVAMGYVDATAAQDGGPAAVGSTVTVDIRGKSFPYTVVEPPFYNREK